MHGTLRVIDNVMPDVTLRACLLLHDHRSGSNFWPENQGADLDPDEIAAAQLAVDCKIEEGSIAQSLLSIKKESDRPYLSRLQRAFRSDLLARAPRAVIGSGGVVV
jgi:hypothetical protein